MSNQATFWSYFRSVVTRAGRDACKAVIADSFEDLAKIFFSAVVLLAILYQGASYGLEATAFSDQVKTILAGVAAALVGVTLVFLLNLLFLAPYQLWREQKEQTEQAEAALTDTEAARIVQECTTDGVVDLERLREEMDRITDPDREYHEEWIRLQGEDAQIALKRAARATATRVRERLKYVDRALESGSQEELKKWQRKSGGELVFNVARLADINANRLPEADAGQLEYALHLIADLNDRAERIGRGEGYVSLSQAAGMYRGRAEKLFGVLAGIAGIDPDWRSPSG